MAKDKELLDTTRGYFQFVSRFFEVIKSSAPHIYHSALELSPEDSIVRHHYHQWSLGHHTPQVVCGIPKSWDHPTIINCNHQSYTWSPCGQFILVSTLTSVEIFDSLTLEKQSSLQLPKPTDSYYYLDHPPIKLSYSPDGHSLVGFFHSAIIIWDIQTVGVVKEIKCSTCPTSLVWSFDGQTIGTVYEVKAKTWVVCAYDIDLRVKVSTGTLQSSLEPCLWSHNKPL